MKGYKISNILYVFPQDATEIPYVDPEVTVIYIQHEQVNAFKEANPSYADLMFGYNFQTITAQPKPFAGHTDDDLTPPTPTDTYSLTLEGEFKDNCSYQYVDGWTPIEDFEHIPEEAGIRIAIVNYEQYTFDKNNTSGKTILVPTLNGIDLAEGYSDMAVDFSMPNANSVLSITEYTPGPATYVLTVDDQTGDEIIQIRPLSVDTSAVEEGTELKAIISRGGIDLGYTFDTAAQAPAIPIVATLDGVQLTKDVDAESVSFTTPGSNATLVITKYTPL